MRDAHDIFARHPQSQLPCKLGKRVSTHAKRSLKLHNAFKVKTRVRLVLEVSQPGYALAADSLHAGRQATDEVVERRMCIARHWHIPMCHVSGSLLPRVARLKPAQIRLLRAAILADGGAAFIWRQGEGAAGEAKQDSVELTSRLVGDSFEITHEAGARKAQHCALEQRRVGATVRHGDFFSDGVDPSRRRQDGRAIGRDKAGLNEASCF